MADKVILAVGLGGLAYFLYEKYVSVEDEEVPPEDEDPFVDDNGNPVLELLLDLGKQLIAGYIVDLLGRKLYSLGNRLAAKRAANLAAKRAAKAGITVGTKVVSKAVTKAVTGAAVKATTSVATKAVTTAATTTATKAVTTAATTTATKAVTTAATTTATKAVTTAATTTATKAVTTAATTTTTKAVTTAATTTATKAVTTTATNVGTKVATTAVTGAATQTSTKAVISSIKEAYRTASQQVLAKGAQKAAETAGRQAAKQAAASGAKVGAMKGLQNMAKKVAQKIAAAVTSKVTQILAVYAGVTAAKKVIVQAGVKMAVKVAVQTAKASALSSNIFTAALAVLTVVCIALMIALDLNAESFEGCRPGDFALSDIPGPVLFLMELIPVYGDILSLFAPVTCFGLTCPPQLPDDDGALFCYPKANPDFTCHAFLCYADYPQMDSLSDTFAHKTKKIRMDTGTIPGWAPMINGKPGVKSGLLFYEDIPGQWDIIAGVAWEKCPPGATDTGIRCEDVYGGGVGRLKSCPPGWHDWGLVCWDPIVQELDDCPKGWIWDPWTCREPIRTEVDDCPAGYRWDPITCWKDLSCSTYCDWNWSWSDGGFCHTKCDGPHVLSRNPRTFGGGIIGRNPRLKGGAIKGKMDHDSDNWGFKCPDGLHNENGLCYEDCMPGYRKEGLLCTRSFTKATRVLPPHSGVCGGDRPQDIAGLCYGDPGPGYRRVVLGTLDQLCPTDKDEWRGYHMFNGINDIGVSCQRATYVRVLSPKLSVYIKNRKKVPGDPDPTPFCDNLTPSKKEQICIENRPPAGNDENGKPLWNLSMNGDVYYKKCPDSTWTFEPENKECEKDDGGRKTQATETIPVQYKMYTNPNCDDVDPKLDPELLCRVNNPPSDEYEVTEDGEHYYKCPDEYDYLDAEKTCIKWAPMKKKTITKTVLGFPMNKEVDDRETFRKVRLDSKPTELIPITYGNKPTGLNVFVEDPELSKPYQFCSAVSSTRTSVVCMKNNPGPEYAVTDDLQNFYEKCREGYTYNPETNQCDKGGADSYMPKMIPIEYDMTSALLCSDPDAPKDKECRENEMPDGHDIAEDGTVYYQKCRDGYTFDNPTKKCVSRYPNRNIKDQYEPVFIPIKYGKPTN